MDAAPAEARGRCTTTVRVRGLGDTCRTRSGLFRVALPDGDSFTTHGFDAPATEHVAAVLDPASSEAVINASVNDISCVNQLSRQPRTTLVYAYPAGGTSRYAEIAPELRTHTYKMSAFLGAESESIDADQSQRLPVECTNANLPAVHEVRLDHDASSDSFATITADLARHGFGNHDGINYHRYLVYYDGSVGSGVAGMAYLYEGDSSKSTDNFSNLGDQVAIEFRWGDDLPHWDVLLHEAGHNMGAVKNDAANSSGAGHCNDGRDIMCYADNGPKSRYDGNACADLRFDCHHDDYFNPAPAPGSYLATHWNIAGPENLFLLHVPTADTEAPSRPTDFKVTAASDTAIGLAWGASTDNVGVTAYRVWRETDSSWQVVASTSSLSHPVGGLVPETSYWVAVSAIDEAGNESALTYLLASTSNTPDVSVPESPTNMSITSSSLTSVTIAWAPASDNIGVTSYTVHDVSGDIPRLLGTTRLTRYTVGGLRPGRTLRLSIVAHDDAGNTSHRGMIDVSTQQDTSAPAAVGRPRQVAASRHSISLRWRASADNDRVSRYRIYRWRGVHWQRIATLSGSTRTFRDTGLRSGRPYLYAVRAVDASGNISDWSTPGRASTRQW